MSDDGMDWNTFTFEKQDHGTGHAVGDGYEWKKCEPYSCTASLNRYLIDAIAKAAIDRMYEAGGYHFLRRNCQHFVRYMWKVLKDPEAYGFTADQSDDNDLTPDQFRPPLHAIPRPPKSTNRRPKDTSLPRTGLFVRTSRSSITPSRIRLNYLARKAFSRQRMQPYRRSRETPSSDDEESPSDGESELRGAEQNVWTHNQYNDEDHGLPDQLAYEQGERNTYVYPPVYFHTYAEKLGNTDFYSNEAEEEGRVKGVDGAPQSSDDDGPGNIRLGEHPEIILHDDGPTDERPDHSRLFDQPRIFASRIQAYDNRLSEHYDELGSTTDYITDAEWQEKRTMTIRRSGPRRRGNHRPSLFSEMMEDPMVNGGKVSLHDLE